MLSLLSKEPPVPDAQWEDLEAANEDAINQGRSKRKDSRWQTTLKNLVVLAIAIPWLLIVIVAAQRIGSEGSCEHPVATVFLLDGLVLFVATLGGGGFKVNARRFSALAGTWFFPIISVAFLVHLLLVALLLASLAGVDYVGDRDGAGRGETQKDGEEGCSRATYAWGMFFLVLHLLCLVVPPTIMCLRCWRKITAPRSTAVANTSDRDERDGD